MNGILADLRFSFRAMRRAPLFATIAIVSLALGIGANTAIFTLMDQLMLRKLPIKDPEQIVMLFQRGSHNGSNMGDRMHSYPIYGDFQTKAQPFSEVLCRRIVSTSIAIDNQTERVQAEMVSGNYFSMLGVKPALGRVFNSEEDDRTHMGHPAVVLSYNYWMNRFAGDKGVLNKKILVNNYPMIIVGVSAAGFAGLDPAQSPSIRVPVLMKNAMVPEWDWVKFDDRRNRWVQVFARLKPGYTAESAQAPTDGLFKQIRQHEMTLPAAAKWSQYMRDRFMQGTLHVVPAATGYSQLRNNFSTALVVLMWMVGLVLLIACANVANLLIARAFARQKEIAVRLSIGATRAQLVRQLLTESMLLATLGGVAGILLAIVLTKGLLALVPSEGNALLINPVPDIRVLAFTLALTVLTGVVFGLVPALRASRPDLWSTLKDTVGAVAGGSGGSLYLRKGLVAAQVALSFLLLFGAGLFVRSLQNLQATETGFHDMTNLVTFQVSPALNGYDTPRAVRFYEQLLTQVGGLPGIKNVGFASVAVLSGNEWDNSMHVEGHQAKDGEDIQAFMNSLSPGYFNAMGVMQLEGRDFRWSDYKEKANVAIVNRKFAEHYFKGQSAIGRHIGNNREKLDTEIIGVVENTLYEGPREGVRRQVFIPHYSNIGVAFYARTSMGSGSAFAAVRNEVKKLDGGMPVYDLKTLSSQLDETLLTERLIALLSAGFGFLATLLAALGLYGVMAFVVARRTKEMGVRMALGASAGSVVWLVMREVLTLLGLGLIVGVPSAIALGRYVSSQLYGVEANDPVVAGVTIAILVAVASLAGLIPARRASRIDPILALRYE
jgi:predicted permease